MIDKAETFSKNCDILQLNSINLSFLYRVEGGELFDKVVSISQYDEPTAKLLFYQMVLACKVSTGLIGNLFDEFSW